MLRSVCFKIVEEVISQQTRYLAHIVQKFISLHLETEQNTDSFDVELALKIMGAINIAEQEARGAERTKEVLEKLIMQLRSWPIDASSTTNILMQITTGSLHKCSMKEQRILWQGMQEFVGAEVRMFKLMFQEHDHLADRINVSVLLWETLPKQFLS